jgi:TRAP-type C4-dicarboxylate transport system substrate-binding protein
MKRFSLAALLGGAAMLAASAACAEQVLLFGTSNPEQHPLNQRILTPWVEAINAEGAGHLRIEFRHGPMLVSHNNFYDRLQDDVVQIVWGVTAFEAGRFPRTLVSGMPFIVENSEQGGVAICRMHARGAFAGDLDGLVPLAFVMFPQASLHFNGLPVTSLADLAGRKVVAPSPASAGLVQAYGGTPISVVVPEIYQALQRKTAEGVVINFTAFPGFRLHEVTTDHLIAPLGGALGMVFMTKARWDALSDEARAVLTKHSGCDVMRALGKQVDAWEADSLNFVKAQPGHTFHAMTPEEVAELVERAGPAVFGAFAARVPGGAELVEMFRAELAAAAAE